MPSDLPAIKKVKHCESNRINARQTGFFSRRKIDEFATANQVSNAEMATIVTKHNTNVRFVNWEHKAPRSNRCEAVGLGIIDALICNLIKKSRMELCLPLASILCLYPSIRRAKKRTERKAKKSPATFNHWFSLRQGKSAIMAMNLSLAENLSNSMG